MFIVLTNKWDSKTEFVVDSIDVDVSRFKNTPSSKKRWVCVPVSGSPFYIPDEPGFAVGSLFKVKDGFIFKSEKPESELSLLETVVEFAKGEIGVSFPLGPECEPYTIEASSFSLHEFIKPEQYSVWLSDELQGNNKGVVRAAYYVAYLFNRVVETKALGSIELNESSSAAAAGSEFRTLDWAQVPFNFLFDTKGVLRDQVQGKLPISTERKTFWAEVAEQNSGFGGDVCKGAVNSESYYRGTKRFGNYTLDGFVRNLQATYPKEGAEGFESQFGKFYSFYDIETGTSLSQRTFCRVPVFGSSRATVDFTLSVTENMARILVACAIHEAFCFSFGIVGCDYKAYDDEVKKAASYFVNCYDERVSLSDRTGGFLKCFCRHLSNVKNAWNFAEQPSSSVKLLSELVGYSISRLTFQTQEVNFYPRMNLGLAEEIQKGYLEREEVVVEDCSPLFSSISNLVSQDWVQGVKNMVRFQYFTQLEKLKLL